MIPFLIHASSIKNPLSTRSASYEKFYLYKHGGKYTYHLHITLINTNDIQVFYSFLINNRSICLFFLEELVSRKNLDSKIREYKGPPLLRPLDFGGNAWERTQAYYWQRALARALLSNRVGLEEEKFLSLRWSRNARIFGTRIIGVRVYLDDMRVRVKTVSNYRKR